MQPLNLPQYEIKVAQRNGRLTIFDDLRGRHVALTPEEWMRQHFVHFLIDHRSYPAGLMANEVQLRVGDKHLRCDTVLYNKEMQPLMIVEYKAPQIQLQQKTFDQIAAYNLLLHADFLVVSNGLQHYCCQMVYEQRTYRFLTEIPDYSTLTPCR